MSTIEQLKTLAKWLQDSLLDRLPRCGCGNRLRGWNQLCDECTAVRKGDSWRKH